MVILVKNKSKSKSNKKIKNKRRSYFIANFIPKNYDSILNYNDYMNFHKKRLPTAKKVCATIS